MSKQERYQKNSFLSGPIAAPLIYFALPLMLSLLLQALYGGVDLAVVGRFSPTESVSAVATGSQVMQSATVIVTGLTMGVTVLLGKAMGAQKPEVSFSREARASKTSLLITFIFAATSAAS